MVDALVMVVYGNGQHLLGPVLADHILVQESFDVRRFLGVIYPSGLSLRLGRLQGVVDVIVCKFDTVAAYEAVNALQQVRNFLFRPAAEHAMPWRRCFLVLGHYLTFLERISSTIPYSRASLAVIQ